MKIEWAHKKAVLINFPNKFIKSLKMSQFLNILITPLRILIDSNTLTLNIIIKLHSLMYNTNKINIIQLYRKFNNHMYLIQFLHKSLTFQFNNLLHQYNNNNCHIII